MAVCQHSKGIGHKLLSFSCGRMKAVMNRC